jgi:Membrane bound beta barrel domain (DUF5777)
MAGATVGRAAHAAIFVAVALATVAAPFSTRAQEVFHSTQSANLSTLETLRGGKWLFEISHRFLPPVSDGADALWGLDGPIYYRLGLSFEPTEGILVGVLRTNLDDNLELSAKAAVFEGGSDRMRYKVGAMAGVAWNTDVVETEGAEDNERQMYAQLMANVLLGERVAVGLVPTYLRNPRILDFETESSFALGLHAQLYLTRAISVLGEWIFSEERPGLEHDSGTFGIEFETRGHFFKLLVTNQARVNPTQILAGTPNPFRAGDLRLGFNVTRVLPF